MLILCCLLVIVCSATSLEEENQILFIILSQDSDYYNNQADLLKNEIIDENSFKNYSSVVYLSHRDFSHVGSWTIFPIIPEIVHRHGDETKWIIFCTDVTRFDYKNLEKTINNYDSNQDLFIGRGLHDREATIIHHFAFFEDPTSFLYPNFGSSFLISYKLLRKISEKMKKFYENEIEFSIDASHELASFILNNFEIKLIHNDNFCIAYKSNCASYVKKFVPCAKGVNDNIYFAVKTCKKYHNVRVPVVKNTWGKYLENIEYFSEEYEESIPTVSLNIKNTERGHCSKTVAIIHYVAKKIESNPKILWVAIVDDDTIISPSLLADRLTCFNSSTPLILGERYGYRVHLNKGYNYITGGGGMILSREIIFSLVKDGVCNCPSPDSPDDMLLGICASKIGGKIIHSPAFHQARPPDYSIGYLDTHGAISFHKHWMIDPYKVYNDWFLKYDKTLLEDISILNDNRHEEL